MDQIIPPQQESDKSAIIAPKKSVLKESFEFLGLTTHRMKLLFVLAFVFVVSTAVAAFFVLPPTEFPIEKTLTVEKGASLEKISLYLKGEHVVRSRFWFESCMRIIGGDRHVVAGDYLFKTPIGACSVAWRIARGISGVPAVRITIPEGTSNQGIANIATSLFTKFDARFFLERARAQEGTLFPDTYFLSANATADDLIRVMRAEFGSKIEPWTPFIERSGHTEREIIIMASLLEKEAKTEEDMALVSGILWKRIARNMPLQVDAPFYYLLGKASSELTQQDLSMKSAYNTYINKGLPAGAIGNPGIVAIRAAIQPKESPYLYYLSDKDGGMHYARTFEEHKANKTKYLK